MSKPSLADRLRTMTMALESDTRGLSKEYTDDLLSVAADIATLEGNMIYLTSCMAASADIQNERKSTPIAEISRQHNLMEACARVLADFPVWRHPSNRATSLHRVETAREAIAKRLAGFKKG